MEHSRPDVGDYPFSLRNARWRTWLRVHTPEVLYYRLGWVVPKARDCGAHEWHANGDGRQVCYHCRVTRPAPRTGAANVAPANVSSPLHDAVEQEDLDRIREMLANGGDPNERDGAGMPLLHHAIDVEADSAIQQEMSMRSATTELLLQCGADPKIEWKGMSALALARQYGHARAVNLIEDALAERETG